ncbi:hypothetical protein FZI91_05975 [Mycobacterium sp. CBMA271]|uniref:hypothetical protein n=1 Tax=unclassified Mycobacteroides TaxID=2618759 RepID=UPI0012DF83C5|nr:MULTISPECIES: hypothetical protein [unclassified Mycobacteroides]MUM15351.1 hypothetical protein [Mycobacteroides sp. CBMA 326]MUM21252.1 hypothetical protein [Mycobacteroides sp. CBMA 271]
MNKLQLARRGLTGLACAALLATAVHLYGGIPSRANTSYPLVIEGAVGNRVVGRSIAVTVTNVYSTQTIVNRQSTFKPPKHIDTEGHWVVIDMVYESFYQQSMLQVALGTGSIIAEITSLGDSSPIAGAGLPIRVTRVFDVPAIPDEMILIAEHMQNQEAITIGAQLDSQLQIAIPRSRVVERPSVELNNGELP